MSRYVMAEWDGTIDATYSTYNERIEVDFGKVTVNITPDEATALRALLEQALAVSALPKCPDCNGRKMLRVDGKHRMCETCDYTGLAPVPEGGAV